MAKKSNKSPPSQLEEENSSERDNLISNKNSPSTSSTLRSPTASVQPSPEENKNEVSREFEGNESDSNSSCLTDFSNDESEEIILDRKELRQCQDDFKNLELEYAQVKQLFYQAKVLCIEAENEMINRGKCPDYIEESQFAYAKSRRVIRKAGIERVFKIWHLEKDIHYSYSSANAQYHYSAMNFSARRTKNLYLMKTQYERAIMKIKKIQDARNAKLMQNGKNPKSVVTTSLPSLPPINDNIPPPRLVFPEPIHVTLPMPLSKPVRPIDPILKPPAPYIGHSIDVGPDVYVSKGTLSYFGHEITPGMPLIVTDPEKKTYQASFVENKYEYIVIQLHSGDRVNIPLRDLALRHCKLELPIR